MSKLFSFSKMIFIMLFAINFQVLSEACTLELQLESDLDLYTAHTKRYSVYLNNNKVDDFFSVTDALNKIIELKQQNKECSSLDYGQCSVINTTGTKYAPKAPYIIIASQLVEIEGDSDFVKTLVAGAFNESAANQILQKSKAAGICL